MRLQIEGGEAGARNEAALADENEENEDSESEECESEVDRQQAPAQDPSSLPAFTIAANAENFQWGAKNGKETASKIAEIYERVVYWRPNLFELPSGRLGKMFVDETARLFESITQGNPLERVAFKAIAIMAHMILQKTHRNMKAKEIKETFEARMKRWQEGDMGKLFDDANAIQEELTESFKSMESSTLSKTFASLIFRGKINAAIRLLKLNAKQNGVLKLDDQVIETLKSKHPERQHAPTEVLLKGPCPQVNSVIFEAVSGVEIRKASRSGKGAAGVSGGDAAHWQRMLHSFGDRSVRCCDAMASFAKRLCAEYMDPDVLEAFLANRLLPLGKEDNGVRPIGIGEIFRRIIGKAINKVLKKKVMKATGTYNMCAGQAAGIEAIIHHMIDLFGGEEVEGLLMIDADNAFNRLNRTVAMLNIRYTCPAYAKVLINCYRAATRLFVEGGTELESQEGTTQGCPFAMLMYAIALMPLLKQLRDPPDPPVPPSDPPDPPVPPPYPFPQQAWYADDSQAAGKLESMRRWWDAIVLNGPKYGYHPKPSKTILIVKDAHMERAKEVFKNTEIKIMPGGARDEENGHRDLGAAIGSSAFVQKSMSATVGEWVRELETLTRIAQTQPHAAHAAFTFGLQTRWVFLQRTMASLPGLLKPLEKAIRDRFIPVLLGDPRLSLSNYKRELFALPPREGGLGILNPVEVASTHYANSRMLTRVLREKLERGEFEYDLDPAAISKTRNELKKARREAAAEAADRLYDRTKGINSRRMIEYNRRKGSGAIFTTIPLSRYGFSIKCKEDYRDILRLRYRLPIPDLPQKCVCGEDYSLDHSQVCQTGGFIHMRHDESKNLFASLCSQVFNDVEVEPKLLPLSGEQMRLKSAKTADDARSDVRVRGFFKRQQSAFFEFRGCHPLAQSYIKKDPEALFESVRKTRAREYKQRISDVDCGSFTAMVFTSTGAVGPCMDRAIKSLSFRLADKSKEAPSHVIGIVRARFAFANARSALICLRGSRNRWSSGRSFTEILEDPAEIVFRNAGLDRD